MDTMNKQDIKIGDIMLYYTTIQHFTSTLVVMSHNTNACSVFMPQRICALHMLSMTPRMRDHLNAKDVNVTSQPKCW